MIISIKIILLIFFISVDISIASPYIYINSTEAMNAYIKEKYLKDIEKIFCVCQNERVSSIHFNISTEDGVVHESDWVWSRSTVYLDIFPHTLKYVSCFAIEALERYQTMTFPSFGNLTKDERDDVIAASLLGIGQFAVQPDSVPTSVYVCWMTSADTLAGYQWKCWADGNSFSYSGYYSTTKFIVGFTGAGAVSFAILADVGFLVLFTRDNGPDPKIKLGIICVICVLSFLASVIVSTIGAWYEIKINVTNPRITSSFFIACWVICSLNVLWLFVSVPRIIKDRSDLPYKHVAINFFCFCLFFFWWVICQLVGVVIETHWSLPFFTGFMSVMAVLFYSITDLLGPLRKLKFPEVKACCKALNGVLRVIVYTVFTIFPALGIAFVIVVISMCFSTVQHESITIAYFQSFLNVVVGAVAVAIQRANALSQKLKEMLQKYAPLQSSQLQEVAQDDRENSSENRAV